jgi:hypothetical protein
MTSPRAAATASPSGSSGFFTDSQRRLTLLVKDGLLAVDGKGRWCRVPQRLPGPVEAAVDIPLSGVAEEVRSLVRQRLMRRHPVGYNRAFLDAYRPNKTRYLSASVRKIQDCATRRAKPADHGRFVEVAETDPNPCVSVKKGGMSPPASSLPQQGRRGRPPSFSLSSVVPHSLRPAF